MAICLQKVLIFRTTVSTTSLMTRISFLIRVSRGEDEKWANYSGGIAGYVQVVNVELVDALTGEVLDGRMNPNKLKLVEAWLCIHLDDLTANWRLMMNGNEVFRIDPLR